MRPTSAFLNDVLYDLPVLMRKHSLQFMLKLAMQDFKLLEDEMHIVLQTDYTFSSVMTVFDGGKTFTMSS